jgi:hypothetical protein
VFDRVHDVHGHLVGSRFDRCSPRRRLVIQHQMKISILSCHLKAKHRQGVKSTASYGDSTSNENINQQPCSKELWEKNHKAFEFISKNNNKETFLFAIWAITMLETENF